TRCRFARTTSTSPPSRRATPQESTGSRASPVPGWHTPRSAHAGAYGVTDGRRANNRDWRTLPRRLVTKASAGRRLVWRARRKTEVDFWADLLPRAPGARRWGW